MFATPGVLIPMVTGFLPGMSILKLSVWSQDDPGITAISRKLKNRLGKAKPVFCPQCCLWWGSVPPPHARPRFCCILFKMNRRVGFPEPLSEAVLNPQAHKTPGLLSCISRAWGSQELTESIGVLYLHQWPGVSGYAHDGGTGTRLTFPHTMTEKLDKMYETWF